MESIHSAPAIPVGMCQGEPRSWGNVLPVWDRAGTNSLEGLSNHGPGYLPPTLQGPSAPSASLPAPSSGADSGAPRTPAGWTRAHSGL